MQSAQISHNQLLFYTPIYNYRLKDYKTRIQVLTSLFLLSSALSGIFFYVLLNYRNMGKVKTNNITYH